MWHISLVFLAICGAIHSASTVQAHASGSSTTPFLIAKPNYRWQFPQDHGEHPDYANEWWYTTGHLATPWQPFQAPHRFGYEATLFRLSRPTAVQSLTLRSSAWKPQQLYMVHVALSDLSGKHFYYSTAYERQNPFRNVVEVEPWRFMAKSLSLKERPHPKGALPRWDLSVRDTHFSLDLHLVPKKDKVFHGTPNGYSKKGSCVSCASMYYSFTHISTTGQVTLKDPHARLKDRVFQVTGNSWFDHEFGSSQLSKTQVGWDWFAIQLDDGQELMLYFMREKNGGVSPQSGATWVSKTGQVIRFTAKELELKVLNRWKSAQSGVNYPSAWELKVPALKLTLRVTPALAEQELYFSKQRALSYWEGANLVTGTRGQTPVQGRAYVELAGYAETLNF